MVRWGMHRFKAIVSSLPYPWQKVFSWGLTFFISEQEPDKVKFKAHTDNGDVVGWSIQVKTSEENVEEAKEFWEEYVEPKLDGDV